MKMTKKPLKIYRLHVLINIQLKYMLSKIDKTKHKVAKELIPLKNLN